MKREDFFEQIQVPYGTRQKLEHYAAMLEEWNARFNLVAKSTLPDLWTRHFLDSAQLFPLLPLGASRLVDMGSGAGFPGLVLSILGVPEVHLIESIGKKARFLEAVAKELDLSVSVHQERIEKLKIPADLITARALSHLSQLLLWAKPFMKEESTALFLKGQKAEAELTEARKYWTFDLEKTASLTDPSALILTIRRLKKRHDPKRSSKSA